jgi:hypothetical protein
MQPRYKCRAMAILMQVKLAPPRNRANTTGNATQIYRPKARDTLKA